MEKVKQKVKIISSGAAVELLLKIAEANNNGLFTIRQLTSDIDVEYIKNLHPHMEENVEDFITESFIILVEDQKLILEPNRF